MPYEHRFHCSTRRPNNSRHDPAFCGIFIHGGTCDAGPFGRNKAVSGANRFTLSIPVHTKDGRELKWSELARHGLPSTEWEATRNPHPTFQRAVQAAKDLQAKAPELAALRIYACTDLHMPNTYSGKYEVQRVS